MARGARARRPELSLHFYLNRRVMEAEATTIGVPMFMTGLAGVAISILSLWYAFQNAAYYTIQEMIFHVIEIFEKEKAKAITAMLGDARARAAKMAKEAGGAGTSGAFAGAVAAVTAARKAGSAATTAASAAAVVSASVSVATTDDQEDESSVSSDRPGGGDSGESSVPA